ncbi:MAG: FHA domain-containing protein, partial [Candidatus Zixiibacteriota bacterium]
MFTAGNLLFSPGKVNRTMTDWFKFLASIPILTEKQPWLLRYINDVPPPLLRFEKDGNQIRKGSGMAEITVKFDDKVIERIVTEKRRVTIGRTNENDIVLENRGVSRKHAIIEFNDNAAVIIDNESLNGTFVNNRRITEEVLRDSDIVTIGKYQLIY